MAKIISIMQDGLEKFVNNNRKAFDVHSPNPNLWAGIEAQLEQQSEEKVLPLFAVKSEQSPQIGKRVSIRQRYLRYASIAAVGLLLLTVGGVIGSQFSQSSGEEAPLINLSDISDEYAETEAYYASQVNESIEKLKKLDYDKTILEDIEELDAAFQELKSELGQSNVFSDEEIIKAMVENYQTKIEILERVLERLSDEKEGNDRIINKKRSNEKINM